MTAKLTTRLTIQLTIRIRIEETGITRRRRARTIIGRFGRSHLRSPSALSGDVVPSGLDI
jgi:hypothetical protein